MNSSAGRCRHVRQAQQARGWNVARTRLDRRM